jgi:hypothetical protein
MATNNLDLTLYNTHSLTTIGFADLSTYGVPPTNMSFEVTPPGWNTVNLFFTPSTVNVYNASNFNIPVGQSNLPDGIWNVKYSVAPNQTTFVEKSFMRVEGILCKYGRNLLASISQCDTNNSDNKRIQSQLQSIKILIDGSIAATNMCDFETACKMYTKANSMLDKLMPCDC